MFFAARQNPLDGSHTNATFGQFEGFSNYDPNLRVSDYFSTHPGVWAVASTSGTTVFYKAGGVFNTYSVQQGVIFHETLHNLTGKNDHDLATQLGVGDPNPLGNTAESADITKALADHGCFSAPTFN
jgi:hypothetical protein